MTLGVDRAFDLIPARLTTPGRAYDSVRIYARNGVLAIWKAQNGKHVLERAVGITGIALVAEGRGSRGPWTVTLEDGETWTCERGAGCGCSSPLKRFTPANSHPTTATGTVWDRTSGSLMRSSP